jgi:hypothetical protein
VIVQTQDDSGCLEEVKEEPKKDDKGKERKRRRSPKEWMAGARKRRRMWQPFSKDRVFDRSKCNTWH